MWSAEKTTDRAPPASTRLLSPSISESRAVIVKSFARIHRANLINAGIIPLTFKNPEDYDKISQGDKLSLAGIKTAIEQDGKIALKDDTNGNEFELECPCPTVRNR